MVFAFQANGQKSQTCSAEWSLRIYFQTYLLFNILLDAICKQGMMEKAEEVLELMYPNRSKPVEITYRIMIKGYCLQGEMDKSKYVSRLMVTKGFPPGLATRMLDNAYTKGRRRDDHNLCNK